MIAEAQGKPLPAPRLGFGLVPAVFHNRKFSGRTIEALLGCGIDAPERLLFMEERDLKKIPGIGKVSLAEIMAYRARFRRE
jgi:DNA-directed RNA polymerase alpha subunit